jgi:hypothetical protein
MTRDGNSGGAISATGQVHLRRGKENLKQRETIFILCDTCFWCATYFGKFMLPAENRCPICLDTELSSFPILPDESFSFNHSQKRGVELKFQSKKE